MLYVVRCKYQFYLQNSIVTLMKITFVLLFSDSLFSCRQLTLIYSKTFAILYLTFKTLDFK